MKYQNEYDTIVNTVKTFKNSQEDYENIVLIGSKALIAHAALKNKNPEKVNRNSDYDFLVDDTISQPEDSHYDFIHSTQILELVNDNDIKDNILCLDKLYSLKMSHIYWSKDSKDFKKNIIDLHLMRVLGAEKDQEFYDSCYDYWKTVKRKNVSLDKSKKEFFSSGVKRIIDHDSLHAAMAFNDKPLFTYFLKDNNEVLTDKNKFFNLDKKLQLQAVIEEASVLTLERNLLELKELPDNTIVKKMFLKQLEYLVTKYSTGWFPEFIINNWDNIIQYDTNNIIKMFLNNKDSNIKPGEYWDNRHNTWWC